MKRNPHIDFRKGIAIIAVVRGHCWAINKPMRNFMYSFHLPLFFCISGYLFSVKAPFKKFVISKAKGILKPYVFYYVCSYLLTLTVFRTPLSLWQAIKGFLLSGSYCMDVNNSALWYLPLFFVSVCVFYWILKIKSVPLQYVIVISGALLAPQLNKLLLYLFPDKLTPINIQALLPSLFFMFVGHEIRKIDFGLVKSLIGNYGLYFIAILMFGAGAFIGKTNFDQIISLYMTYEFYFYPLLILPLIVLISCETRNRQIEHIGSISLTVLGMHRPIMHIFSDILHLDTIFRQVNSNSFLSVVFFSALSIIIICIGKIAYGHIKTRLTEATKEYFKKERQAG